MQIAIGFFRSGISLHELENAILLGCARKYMSAINVGARAPIVSLRYFSAVVDEMSEQSVPAEFWVSLRRKLPAWEEQWKKLNEPN